MKTNLIELQIMLHALTAYHTQLEEDGRDNPNPPFEEYARTERLIIKIQKRYHAALAKQLVTV